jgi:acetyl esterase
MMDTVEVAASHDISVEDVEFYKRDGKSLLARLYRPRGTGPFPTLLDIHGGAWVKGDRMQNAGIDEALARRGILVCSIDFRMPPEAPYPASSADINLGIRWLKAHARELGGRPDRVGGFGTSSGGHQVLLAAMRPNDPRYAAIALAGAPDARLAYVISGWGVLCPLTRYRLAKERKHADFIRSHDAFWGTEAAMSEGSLPLIFERGEKVDGLPPALVFQGDADEWVPTEVAERLANGYRAAGGALELVLLPGAKHSFFREDPKGANAVRAMSLIESFARKHG